MARKKKFWKGIRVSKPMTCNTGEQAPAYKATDDFFQEVEKSIRETYPDWPLDFEIKLYPLYPEELVGKTGGGPTAHLKGLFCGDRLVCSAIVTSTDLNFDNFSFALYKQQFPWSRMYRERQRGEYD